MIALPKRVAVPEKETDVSHRIRVALNKLGWCTMFRNSNTKIKDLRGIPIHSGLGNGSNDLVGYVQVVRFWKEEDAIVCAGCEMAWGVDNDFYNNTWKCKCEPIARFFGLEVKRPILPTPYTDAQRSWTDTRNAEGAYCAVVDNVEDAIEHAMCARLIRHETVRGFRTERP